MKIMSQSRKPVDPFVFSFRLNPNVSSHIRSGFKECLENPIEIHDPEPEFALTVPGDLSLLHSLTGKKDRH
jgi:hypothetical protein